MKDARVNFNRYINFEIYESMFRTFCKKPVADHDYLMRANYESFSEGIKFWYNGIENKALADIIYNSLGKGLVNH